MKLLSVLAGPTLTLCAAALLAFAIPSPVDGPPAFPDRGTLSVAHRATPPTATPAAPPIEFPPARTAARASAEDAEATGESDLAPGLFLNLGVGYYTQHAARVAGTQTIEIRVDPAFVPPEREKILDAVREWNHVLNGHVRIAIGNWESPAAAQPVSAVAPPPADPVWSVYRAYSIHTNQLHPLAVTVSLPSPSATILVFVDRLRSARIDRVMLHEIGHALGLQHDPRGHLMREQYSGNEQICIDRAAVEKLAQLRGIPVRELNWCTY